MMKIGCVKQKGNRFYLYHNGKCYGSYDSYEEAEENRKSFAETYERPDYTVYVPVFLDRLNMAIGESGLSLTEICRRAKIDRTNITYYMQGGRLPSVKSLIGLALTLNVSADWLLGLKGE